MKRIFGLDYGRGTMAGFYVDEGAEVLDPHAIMDSHGEPSGFAVMDAGTTRLGLQMYNIPGRDYGRIKEFHVNVKELPHGNERDDAMQIQYARAWRERIMEKTPQFFNDGYEEYWFIGCPTGWRSKKTIDDYAKIFTAAGFKNVVIVPESNAAMMHAEKAYGFVKDVDEKVGVLCIDLGAYSADSTYVRPGKSVVSYGGYVGASLIEKMIVTENLNDEHRTADRPYVSSEVLKAIREEYRESEKFRTYVLIAARKLKEQYYTALAEGNDFSDIDCTVVVQLDEDMKNRLGVKLFTIYVNDRMTKSIIHDRSVRSVLGEEFDDLAVEVRKELEDRSWGAGLKSFLQKTLEMCPDFAVAAQAGGSHACLIVTGGASLMSFVQDIISEVMPNVTLYKDPDPMSTIAKGLVFFGPEKLKAMAFDKEFERLLTQDENGNPIKEDASNSVLNERLSRSHDELGLEFIADTVIKMVDSIVDAANGWANRQFDSDQIASQAYQAFASWFEGDMVKEYNQKHVPNCKKHIVTNVNKLFEPLLEAYGFKEDAKVILKESDLTLKYAECFLKDWKGFLEAFKGMILEENEIYSKFPNPGAFNLFSPSRKDILSSAADTLNERNRKWREQCFETLMSYFNSPKVYGPFKMECLAEVLVALRTKKKSKLGELIVEESFDDDVVTPEVVD